MNLKKPTITTKNEIILSGILLTILTVVFTLIPNFPAEAGCTLGKKENEIRQKYNGRYRTGNQYNALQAIPIAVDVYFFGGVISTEWAKQELAKIGVDTATFLAESGFNPSRHELIGDLITFRCNAGDSAPLNQMWGSNIFKPYIAIRDKGDSSNPDNVEPPLVFFKTRRGHFINAYDSIGNVSAIPGGNTKNADVSDEIFQLIDVNGGSLNNGDKICLKTRRGYTLNAHDSTGDVKAIPTGNCTDINASDEIFTINKVNGSGTINSGDKICLKTRKGYTLNAHGSVGNVSAIPTGNCTDINASDEIFTIYF